MIKEQDLDFWIKHNYNVLFIGNHGTGKTSIVKEAFSRNNLRWKYFSASTMDPWVDMIGVPKEQRDEDGTPYLDLVRPIDFQKDEIDALFFDEFNRCCLGSTKIQLLDGKEVMIKDLVGQDHFYVYSYDIENKKVVVGRGHSARLTGEKQKVVKVTLDNGESIICTPDHPFLMRDGSYKHAGNLVANDSLMPLTKKIHSDRQTRLLGYEELFQPDLGVWEFTHRLADDYNLDNCRYDKNLGTVRHHIDFNKLNNSPENIIRMTWNDHCNLHHDCASRGGKRAHEKHPDLVARSIGTPESKKKALENTIKTRSTSKKYKILRSKLSKEINGTTERREEQRDLCKKAWETGQFNFDQKEAHKKRTRSIAINFGKQLPEITPDFYEMERSKITGRGRTPVKVERLSEYFGSFEGYRQAVEEAITLNNHKVVSVEDAGFEDVYDISVDKYHNFAIGAGVFIHNSHKKIRNACMELLQFKSINGKKFNNLKLIWAAINPDNDGDYDVEKLDPAQEDRFHIKVQVPYKPDRVYFIRNYGEDVAKAAISWWDGLPAEQKVKVSPRRLDYALDVFRNNGDMRYVLDEATNVSKLVLTLKHGPISEALQKLQDTGNVDDARAFLAQENNYAAALEWLVKRVDRMKFFLPTLPIEKISTLIAGYKTALDAALDLVTTNAEIKKLIEDILCTNQNKNLVYKINKEIKMNKKLSDMFITPQNFTTFNFGAMPEKPFFNTGHVLPDIRATLVSVQQIMKQKYYMSTFERKKLYKIIEKAVPSKLATQEALDILEFLSWVAAHSHIKTLVSLKTFMGLVNHCINELSQNENLSWDQIDKTYHTKIKFLSQKLKAERSLGERLYCPTGKTKLVVDGKISIVPVDEIKCKLDEKKVI